MCKKILSLAVAFVLLLSCFPVPAHAQAGVVPTLKVDTVSGGPGSIVEVNVRIKDNPGMLGLNFQVFWDNGTAAEIQNGTGLKLLSAEPGEAVDVLYYVPPANLVSGSYHVWDALESYASKDGVVLKLRFQLPEGKNCKDKYNIWVDSYPDDNPNKDMLPQEFKHEAGKIVSFMPGDVNSNGKLDSIDVTMIRRYVSDGRRTDPNGYNVTLDELAADVNDDGTLSALDVTLIRRFIADGRVTNPDGYNVTLKPSSRTCLHTQRTAHPSKAPTCTEGGTAEYWVCDKCGKYLNRSRGGVEIDPSVVHIDPLGHDPQVVPGKAPTYTETGLTEGSVCARCGVVLKKQEVIKPLEQLHHSIAYNVANQDPYLESLNLQNPNPDSYPELDGLQLIDLDTPGYHFEGWYDGNGKDANRITEIPANSTKNYHLYAHWAKIDYRVQFDISPLKSKRPSETYTIDTGLPIHAPTSYGYWFLGWTDQNGNWVDSVIKPGETGHKILTAHWTSVRNATHPVKDNNPIIYDDPENGRMVFAFEIGVIRNIPVKAMEQPHTSIPGESYSHVKGVSYSVSQEEAKTLSQTVAEATTKSATMTLSKDWNQHVEISKEHESEVSQEIINATRNSYEVNGQWSVGSSTGVSHVSTNQTSDGSSHTEGGQLSGTMEMEATVPGVGGLKASGTRETHHDDTTSHEVVDTVSDSANFNINSGYGVGHAFSSETSSQTALTNRINEKHGYGESTDVGGGTVESNSHQTTNTVGRESSSTVAFTNATITSEDYTHNIDCLEQGTYRLTAGGTAHVFAVVGYDVATKAYFVTTHTVMENKLVPYMDFSADGSFTDQENGVIPCEIPHYVYEYVTNKTKYTPGLTPSAETGRITRYDGESTRITVPEFMSVNKSTGPVSVHVTGIETGAFAGKNIERITLPASVTEIPAGAFRGCTNLVTVDAPGVTRIGANAFEGCTALTAVHTGELTAIGGSAFKGCTALTFTVDSTVTELNANSFNGIHELTVNAGTADIVKAAIASGAAKLTVKDMSSGGLTGNVSVPASVVSFRFDGRGKTYSGLKFQSVASEYTAICNSTFNKPNGIALEITSPKVLLESTTVNSDTLCMKLTADNAIVELSDINHMNSTGSAAVLTNNVTFAKYSGTSLDSALATNSKIVVVSKAQGKEWVRPQDAVLEREHATFSLTFDPNGGSVSETSRLAFVGTNIGKLPVPNRDYYTFDGWYTAVEGGAHVTANTIFNDPFDRTVYAHWTENPVSDWVPAESMPVDGQIIDEKWTYDKTSNITSDQEYVEGYTLYNTTSEWGPYGSWTGWSENAVSASDSTQVEQRTGYHYYWYTCPYCGIHMHGYGPCYTWAGGCGKTINNNYHAERFDVPYSSSMDFHGTGVRYINTDGGRAFAYTNPGSKYYVPPQQQYRYRVRELIYTYYHTRTEHLESTYEISNGGDISNVQKWVRYRAIDEASVVPMNEALPEMLNPPTGNVVPEEMIPQGNTIPQQETVPQIEVEIPEGIVPQETETPMEGIVPQETEAPAEESIPQETVAPSDALIPEETTEPDYGDIFDMGT